MDKVLLSLLQNKLNTLGTKTNFSPEWGESRDNKLKGRKGNPLDINGKR